MERKKTTFGYKEIDDNGNIIRYSSELTSGGFCFKDAEAFENDENAVCYIRESICCDCGEDDMTPDKINAVDDIFTRKQMTEWVENHVKNYAKPFKDSGFVNHLVEMMFNELDWCGFDMVLEDVDLGIVLAEYAVALMDEMKVPRNSYDFDCLAVFLEQSDRNLEDAIDEFVNLPEYT